MPYERSFDEPTEPLERVCRHLRSKAIYVAGNMEPPPEIESMGSGHCWCSMTQHVFGPDDQQVDRRGCNSSRVCYEAML
jgi:hypothetical protein